MASSLFLAHNEALAPPYRVLIDTNFINFSLQNKLELVSGMMDCLYAKCTYYLPVKVSNPYLHFSYFLHNCLSFLSNYYFLPSHTLYVFCALYVLDVFYVRISKVL